MQHIHFPVLPFLPVHHLEHWEIFKVELMLNAMLLADIHTNGQPAILMVDLMEQVLILKLHYIIVVGLHYAFTMILVEAEVVQQQLMSHGRQITQVMCTSLSAMNGVLNVKILLAPQQKLFGEATPPVQRLTLLVFPQLPVLHLLVLLLIGTVLVGLPLIKLMSLLIHLFHH